MVRVQQYDWNTLQTQQTAKLSTFFCLFAWFSVSVLMGNGTTELLNTTVYFGIPAGFNNLQPLFEE